MKICVLGSGSKGNCAFVRTDACSFLVDAGLSARQVKLRLGKIGHAPDEIAFILLTHEHSDHVAGLDRLVKLYGVDVLTTRGTFDSLGTASHVEKKYIPLVAMETSEHRGITITPVPVSHNAADPVGYIIEHDGKKVAFTTDLGFVSNQLVGLLTGLDAWLIESNYDHEMLLEGSYPMYLKKRISSLTGHLSNDATGNAIVKVNPSPKTHLLLAHLSQSNNHSDLAYSRVREIMESNGLSGKKVMVCLQKDPSPIIEL